MAFMTIEAEAADLLIAGATAEQIDEMESSLRFCIAGMNFKNGQWEITPPVARILRDTPPGDALPRLQRGIKVCEAARRLCLV
jgi:hypothetical protein